MAATLSLDPNTWDLQTDINGNIAVLIENPTDGSVSSLAQDAASAIRTFLGECYWDITVGVPYSKILGQAVPLAILKQYFVDAALTASPDIASAQVFFTSFANRAIAGQVQVVSNTGLVTAASFAVTAAPGSIG